MTSFSLPTFSVQSVSSTLYHACLGGTHRPSNECSDERKTLTWLSAFALYLIQSPFVKRHELEEVQHTIFILIYYWSALCPQSAFSTVEALHPENKQ